MVIIKGITNSSHRVESVKKNHESSRVAGEGIYS